MVMVLMRVFNVVDITYNVPFSFFFLFFFFGQLYPLPLYDSCVALPNLQIHIDIILGR